MKGHMRERSGSWELRVFAGPRPSDRRKRYLTRTVRGGKREAQRALAALIVEAGENGAPRRETFAELVEEWFAHAEPDFSPKTAAETRRILDRTVIPRLGDRRVDKLRPSDLDALYGELRTTGGAGGPSTGPGHREADPWHHPPSTRPGGALGMGRQEPCGASEPTPCLGAEDRAAVASRRREAHRAGGRVRCGPRGISLFGRRDRCAP
jgi:Phage integrase, N-terminal SAM-like domain